ncbi:hypothetical protein ATANTOWER_008772 [Ataeniobius toweri]|uniref:Uncharacterized protein n=1 Tax=Ataeniobius toweri TaxID=208326 RepID=A0ABU7ANF1_9TELE|nr:hypothetical protein [Ataeniobius toweri]
MASERCSCLFRVAPPFVIHASFRMRTVPMVTDYATGQRVWTQKIMMCFLPESRKAALLLFSNPSLTHLPPSWGNWKGGGSQGLWDKIKLAASQILHRTPKGVLSDIIIFCFTPNLHGMYVTKKFSPKSHLIKAPGPSYSPRRVL